MSKPLKPKRGTTAENDAYIGEAYEVTLDTEKHTLRVHDGVMPGGHEMASGAALDDLSEEFNTNVGTIREDTVAAAQLAASMSQGESGSLTLEGVAAEVERKAALDLSNLSTAGRSLAAGLGMPSERFINLTLGANGASYIATADGVVVFSGRPPSAGNALSLITQNQLWSNSRVHSATNITAVYIPVKKGTSFVVSYDGSPTETTLRFYYAEGAE